MPCGERLGVWGDVSARRRRIRLVGRVHAPNRGGSGGPGYHGDSRRGCVRRGSGPRDGDRILCHLGRLRPMSGACRHDHRHDRPAIDLQQHPHRSTRRLAGGLRLRLRRRPHGGGRHRLRGRRMHHRGTRRVRLHRRVCLRADRHRVRDSSGKPHRDARYRARRFSTSQRLGKRLPTEPGSDPRAMPRLGSPGDQHRHARNALWG